jgi:general secretion pathway protein N
MRFPRPRGWLPWFGLLAYLVFLSASTPAGWLAYAVNRGTRNHVLLLNPQGTVWTGQAELLLNQSRPESAYLGTLHWNISAWRLITLTLGAHLQLKKGDNSAKAAIFLRHSSLRLQDARADVDLGSLAPVFPALSMFGIGGHVSVRSTDLYLSPHHMAGSAKIHWDHASTASLGDKPFGNYSADINAGGNSINMSVTSSGTDALRVQGSGSWSPFTSGLARFDGTVQSVDPKRFPPQMLAFVGQDAGGGKRRVHYQRFLRLAWGTGRTDASRASLHQPGNGAPGQNFVGASR